jgi:hypothetical protein
MNIIVIYTDYQKDIHKQPAVEDCGGSHSMAALEDL